MFPEGGPFRVPGAETGAFAFALALIDGAAAGNPPGCGEAAAGDGAGIGPPTLGGTTILRDDGRYGQNTSLSQAQVVITEMIGGLVVGEPAVT